MDLLQFHRMRTAIQGSASPGRDTDLESVEQSLRDLLLRSGVFEDVEVGHTDDPDQLVIALCTFNPLVAEAEVARRLETIWRDRVSYPFWEAHALHVESEHVEFQAASRYSSRGHYVTVHLVAQKAPIPAQRVAVD
ncbi:hypothetical protein [Nocardioides mesophilus]|uniref:Uncharacterized protein n=1 Tax=Nocardioides mesophilus TaxID=433659 RepID=A0A7G9R7X6_9ACTN|nr:hypothetical protein [Nocardioides mesophilus]QNN51701.1 hypothetical protein H9L09_14175 [Nocardioides mesophilus]